MTVSDHATSIEPSVPVALVAVLLERLGGEATVSAAELAAVGAVVSEQWSLDCRTVRLAVHYPVGKSRR